jgi:hypothetical protein
VTDFAIQAGKETSDVEDDRRQLLGDDNKPRQRTADEIKAAYGHAKALDASSAAGLARDKLMERGQKLQVTILESQICDSNSILLPWVKILQYIL